MDKLLTANKSGRRAYKPTEEDRLKVYRMCALGTPQYQIAIVFGITPKTLRRHFRHELNRAAIEANFTVADTLFKMATDGKHPAATIFWAKTRNGFKNGSAGANLPEPPPTEKPAPPQPPSTIVVINNDGAPIDAD